MHSEQHEFHFPLICFSLKLLQRRQSPDPTNFTFYSVSGSRFHLSLLDTIFLIPATSLVTSQDFPPKFAYFAVSRHEEIFFFRLTEAVQTKIPSEVHAGSIASGLNKFSAAGGRGGEQVGGGPEGAPQEGGGGG